MFDPFDLLLDLLLINWLLNDEGSRLLKVIVVLVLLSVIVAILGLCLGWW